MSIRAIRIAARVHSVAPKASVPVVELLRRKLPILIIVVPLPAAETIAEHVLLPRNVARGDVQLVSSNDLGHLAVKLAQPRR